MKNFSFLFATLVLFMGITLQSCTEANNATATGTRISGTIENGANMKVFLDKMTFTNQSEVIQKGDLDSNGKFQLDLPEGVTNGLYRMRIGGSLALLVFDGTEKHVKVSGEISDMKNGNITIEGAPDATAFHNMLHSMTTKQTTKEDAKQFVEKTPNPISAAMITQMFLGGDEKYVSTANYTAKKLRDALPNSSYANDFSTYATQLTQQIAQQKAAALVSVGAPAPDIKLPTPDGKTYSLSDLKGKVVLLDFWASWCGPCRKSNPHVVEMYDKYNKKGFEVFNVSLDGINPRLLPKLKTQEQKDEQLASAKDRWVAAIKQDKLKWPYHVSDLQHWNSAPAKTYGVRSIPRTFVIDRDGNIAGANLRGVELEAKLRELL